MGREEVLWGERGGEMEREEGEILGWGEGVAHARSSSFTWSPVPGQLGQLPGWQGLLAHASTFSWWVRGASHPLVPRQLR